MEGAVRKLADSESACASAAPTPLISGTATPLPEKEALISQHDIHPPSEKEIQRDEAEAALQRKYYGVVPKNVRDEFNEKFGRPPSRKSNRHFLIEYCQNCTRSTRMCTRAYACAWRVCAQAASISGRRGTSRPSTDSCTQHTRAVLRSCACALSLQLRRSKQQR